MKRVYVNEEWCLGCKLCEYYCTFANSDEEYMADIKGLPLSTRLRVEEKGKITFAVSCRHCVDPKCIFACISGALSKSADGVVTIDKTKCVGCGSCVMMCPYGAIEVSNQHVATKCELCTNNKNGKPACVEHCPNAAIVFEER